MNILKALAAAICSLFRWLRGGDAGLAHPVDKQTVMMSGLLIPSGGHFLNAIFDVWIRNDIGDVGVQIFEQTLVAGVDYRHRYVYLRQPAVVRLRWK